MRTHGGLFGRVMLALLGPGLLLPAALSVLSGAAGDAINQRTSSPEVPAGWSYIVPMVFGFILFVSMSVNGMLLLRKWNGVEPRGVPSPIAQLQLATYITLGGWCTLIALVWMDLPFGVLGIFGVLAPLILIGLSITTFAMIIRRPHAMIERPVVEGLRLTLPSLVLAAFLLAMCGAVVGARVLLPLDPTAENAANWLLVVLGVPWSIGTAVFAWVMVPLVLYSAFGDDIARQVSSIVVTVMIAIPMLVNAALTIAVLAHPTARARFAPRITLEGKEPATIRSRALGTD